MGFHFELVILAILFTVAAATFTSKKQHISGATQQFEFLGSRKSFTTNADGSKREDEYMYYLSVFPGVWETARQDCLENVFGPGGDLVSLETEEEAEWLYEWIELRGSGGTVYWTSGEFLIADRSWHWAANGQGVNYTDWAEGHPGPVPIGRHRIAINHHQSLDADWLALEDSETRRFICELNSTGPVDPSPKCTDFSDSASECLESSLNCAFCYLPQYSNPRCDSSENLIANGCTLENQCPTNIIAPTIHINLDMSNSSYTTERLQLCPNQTRKFNVTFKFDMDIVDLDLYLLMDLSGSMNDDLMNMVSFSADLVEMARNISDNFRIGFGTFIEKRFLGDSLDYSYRNELSLTNDAEFFKDAIGSVGTGHGGDNPESQLDAMFQVAKCTSEIGWRPNARHILVVMSDDGYHFAGDGSASSLPPFPADSCLLDVDGNYTGDSVYDYPSEEQIINAFQANQIIPIFAITPGAISSYTDLASRINPSGIGQLTSDSSNILELIEEQYSGISGKIEVNREDSEDMYLDMTFRTKCTGNVEEETNVCEIDSTTSSVEISFEIDMTLKECPDSNFDKTFRIRALGLPMYFDALFQFIC